MPDELLVKSATGETEGLGFVELRRGYFYLVLLQAGRPKILGSTPSWIPARDGAEDLARIAAKNLGHAYVGEIPSTPWKAEGSEREEMARGDLIRVEPGENPGRAGGHRDESERRPPPVLRWVDQPCGCTYSWPPPVTWIVNVRCCPHTHHRAMVPAEDLAAIIEREGRIGWHYGPVADPAWS